MQAADTRIESSTESATAVRRGHIQKWRTRRVNLALCDARTRVHQERGASAPRGSRQRTFKGFAPMSVRLPTVHQRTPTQSRYYILDNIHGGLTPAALVSGEPPPACAWRFPLHVRSRNHGGLTPAALVPGESPPACAWRFPLHARSPNHGGLTPAALVSECERLPAKLRLLRCTIARAPGAGGVSPPWLAVTHVQGLRVTVSAIADRASADPDAVAVLHPRQHPRRADAAILRWANRCLLVRCDFFCTRVLLTTAG